MPKNKQLYDELGVAPNADEKTIKKAYRKKAMKAHPDREGGSEEEFKAINNAYAVLGDESRRKKYDENGDTRPDVANEQSNEHHAYLLLADVIERIMNQPFEAEYNNVLDILKQTVTGHIVQCKEMETNINKNIEKRQVIIKRLVRINEQDKEDPLAGILNHGIGKLQSGLADVLRAIEIDKEILKILEGYNYTVSKKFTKKQDPDLVKFIQAQWGTATFPGG